MSFGSSLNIYILRTLTVQQKAWKVAKIGVARAI